MECELKFSLFNCNGFKNRNYDYVTDIFKDCDVLGIIHILRNHWRGAGGGKRMVTPIYI